MIAGMESKKIRRRSIRGKRHLLDNYSTDKPVFLGGTPTFGYMNVNKQWVINPDESKWVKWMYESYAQGMSTLEIQSELNINGISPRRARSGLWGLATIQKMLGNESYTGLKRWFDKEIEKEWIYQIPQIIPVSLFQKVQKKLEENQKNKDNNKKHHFLLDGLLHCDCGLRFGNESKQRPHGKTETYYCVSRGRRWRGEQVEDCLNRKGLSRDKTDQAILHIVKSVAKDSVKLKEMFKNDILNKKKESDKSLQNDIKRLETKVKRLQKKIEVTVDNIAKVEVAILQGQKDEKVGKQTIKLLEQERSFVETEYKKSFLEIEELDSQREWLDWLGKYGESLDYNTRSEDKRRDFVHGLVKKINVKPVYDENRDGVLKQLGHIFEVTFKMGIVGDKLVWKDESNKKQGYDLKEGQTTHKTKVIDVTVSRGQPKKKEENQDDRRKDRSDLLRNCRIVISIRVHLVSASQG